MRREEKKIVYIIPFLIVLLLIYAQKRGVLVYQSFLEGAEGGIKTAFSILPALVAILSASAMLRESGAISYLADFLSPVTKIFKIPSELIPLFIIRPLSGGGSIALLTDIIKTYGSESVITNTACILCASTETTFYTIMVYFGKTKAKYLKRVICAAVFGDLIGILSASILGMINL